MNLIPDNFKKDIKRRNFFAFLGVSLLSIFSISKLPLKIFQSKVNKEIYRNKKIRIEENRYAVKREIVNRIHG